jgi:hypothetical protein
VIGSAVASGADVIVACGRHEPDAAMPDGVEVRRIRGLATAVASSSRLDGLDRLLEGCGVVHLQNVMNPVVLEAAVSIGRTVVTVQDHRVFCPARGKTLPGGARCAVPMSDVACTLCLPDGDYRTAMLALTRARRDALSGARLVVLSSYMAAELRESGLPGALVLPPWVEPGPDREDAGSCLLLGGRLVGHKGVLDGWQAWKATGVGLPLRVAGAGPLEGRLEGADLLGWLPVSKLRTHLRRARALLFPSFWQEPFGILGVQALAEGTPVIVTDSGGTSEWSDVGCVRVPAGDVPAMADAIARIAAESDRALRLGREGQRMVAARFSRSSIEPQLQALYREVANG